MIFKFSVYSFIEQALVLLYNMCFSLSCKYKFLICIVFYRNSLSKFMVLTAKFQRQELQCMGSEKKWFMEVSKLKKEEGSLNLRITGLNFVPLQGYVKSPLCLLRFISQSTGSA